MKNQKNEFNKSLKLIAKSSIIVFIGIFLSKLFTYIYRIIIARNFGPTEYGLFTLAIMITGWFIAFTNFGLNQGLIRYVALFRGKNQKESIKSTFKSSFKLTFVTSILGGIILFFLSELIASNLFHEPGLAIYLKVFALAVPLTVLLEILLAVVLAYERVGWYSFIHNIFGGAVKITLLAILIFAGMKTGSVLISYIAAIFGTFILAVYLCKSQFSFLFEKTQEKKEKRKKLFRELFSYSWPLLFYGLIWQIFHWTDSFVIGLFKTATEVGIYNAAVPIAFFLTAVAQIFLQLFFPIITKEHAMGNNKTVKELSKQVGKWIFMLNLPIFILLFFFPGAVLNLLFGAEYLGAENSLRFLGIGIFIFSIFNVSNRLLAMAGKSKTILIDLTIVFIINIILNVYFIPKYGITGAAVATTISLILLSTIFTIQSIKYFSVAPLRKKMVHILCAGAISTVLTFYISSQIAPSTLSGILLAIFFLAVYILLTFFLKGFDKNDVMVFKSALRKLKIAR